MSNSHGSHWARPDLRLACYMRDEWACAYCGAAAEDGAALSLDHLQPRELGGGNEPSNLITACVSCNSARQALPLRAWLASLRDKGRDTKGLAARIRRLTAKPLDRAAAKKILAARKAAGKTDNQ